MAAVFDARAGLDAKGRQSRATLNLNDRSSTANARTVPGKKDLKGNGNWEVAMHSLSVRSTHMTNIERLQRANGRRYRTVLRRHRHGVARSGCRAP